jgi:hypothetical protein
MKQASWVEFFITWLGFSTVNFCIAVKLCPTTNFRLLKCSIRICSWTSSVPATKIFWKFLKICHCVSIIEVGRRKFDWPWNSQPVWSAVDGLWVRLQSDGWLYRGVSKPTHLGQAIQLQSYIVLLVQSSQPPVSNLNRPRKVLSPVELFFYWTGFTFPNA